jgi:EAL domain-containing protein (putative c-di-GMP-specific phosphodiesterase class I)/GGDEF domain-containing protein
MSLIRQLWLLLAAVLLLAIGGAVSVNLLATRDVLQDQLRLKNNDNAQSLALVLSQQKGDAASMQLAIAALFDTGFYRSVRLERSDGAPAIEQLADAVPMRAPAWFARLLPIDAAPGVAQVADGWKALGSVQVASQSAYAHDALWAGGVRAASWMLVVGVLAGALSWLAVRRIQTPLDATVAQARSLEAGQFITVAEPQVPELRRVAAAMNGMVRRVQALFELQASQAETLRRQAHCDALTGVAHRPHFMSLLAALLQREDGADGGGLVLVRLADVSGMNRALGRQATDEALRFVAQVLKAYPERVPDCLVGRLNGSDFVLCLPTAGMAAETAASIAAALHSGLPAHGPGIQAHVGAVEILRDAQPGELMGLADLALARAEARQPFAVEVLDEPRDTAPAAAQGERSWRSQLLAAIEHRRARLVDFPLLDRSGALVHMECPLRLQLQEGGTFEVAARWLPQTLRNRLTAVVDSLAVNLALEAIARDGITRAVNIAPASVFDGGFAVHLSDRFAQQPQVARALWLEVAEVAAVEHFGAVQEFARVLRPLGVRVGLEHAGERLHRIERLYELGLDYVKLDASVCLGVAQRAAAREFVRSTVALLHAVSVKVYAEGVVDGADAEALWACGVDAVTGPWASAQ